MDTTQYPFVLPAYNTNNFNNSVLGWTVISPEESGNEGQEYFDMTNDAEKLLQKFGGVNHHTLVQ